MCIVSLRRGRREGVNVFLDWWHRGASTQVICSQYLEKVLAHGTRTKIAYLSSPLTFHADATDPTATPPSG